MKVLFVLITGLLISMLSRAWAQTAIKPEILVLHSYSQGYAWTASEMKGIQEIFEKEYPDLEVVVEYMDWKNYPTPENLQVFLTLLRYKYQKRSFDIVITTDNVAFDFARNYREQLFPKSYLIFAGVNNFQDSMIAAHKRITGVVEAVDYIRTIDSMLEIHPKTKRIAVVLDSTEISLELLKELRALFPRWKDKVQFKVLHDLPIEEVQKEVSLLKEGDLLLNTNFIIDAEGKNFSQRQAIRFINKHSKVPAYGLWEIQLGFGIVGGWLLDGRIQGQVAAELAIKALNGENPPVVKVSPSRFVLDYNQLNRFRIPIEMIPPQAELINLPKSIFNKYRSEIISTLIIVFILILSNVILIINIRKRHLAEVERDNLLIEEKKARQAAEEAVRARETFIALAAHEFRTPLTVLILQLQLLLRAARGETKKPSTQEDTIKSFLSADSQAKRLQALVEDLLYIAHERKAMVHLELHETDLSEIVRNVSKGLDSTIQSSGSKLELHLDEGCQGFWDSKKLEKLVTNLLSNALKFGAHKPIELSVKCEEQGVSLIIKDQGIGIYSEDQGRIFEKFGRAVSEYNFGGFGLGLYISQLIVEAHQGSIKVNSEPGQGSVFSVFLPYTPHLQTES